MNFVLLHGFAGGPASWQRVVRGFASGWEAHALELAGHGATPIGAVRGFEDEVDRLAARIDAIAAPRLLVGYSLGGRLALGLLAHAASSFAGALLIGAHGGLSEGPEGLAEREARRASDGAWAARIERDGVVEFERAWSALPLFASQARLPESVLGAQREQRRAHRAPDLAAAMRALSLSGMPDYSVRLAAVEVPVLLMAGALDGKFREQAERLAHGLRRGRCVVVEGAGHNVPLEDPEAVVRAIDTLALEVVL